MSFYRNLALARPNLMNTDLDLLRRYHEHADAYAFQELVQMHAGMVFATARRVTRDPALAEDVAQETFLELVRHAPSVRESVGAWLHRVAWRRACNAVRDASARRRHEAAAAPDTVVREGREATWEELEPLIDAALDELPDKLRAPLVEHFLEGRTQQEIASRLGVSQPTVSRLLDTAIARLRSQLQQRGLIAGAALATVVAAQAVTPAPATLVGSLGKLAVSGVGGADSAAGAEVVKAGSARGMFAQLGKPLVVVAIAALVVITWMLWRAPVRSGSQSAPLAATGAGAANQAQDWQGRAFCPMCAAPMTAGRTPEHGIFIRTENGREVVYDLSLSQPYPNFHARLCVPSMDDVHAVRVQGAVQTRNGRLTLVATALQPRVR